MQTFYPGIYFKEVEFAGGARPIEGIDMSLGATVGYFEKGPIGKPVKVSAANFAEVFGGPIADAFGWYALNGFFANNPSGQCYVVRTAKYTDITDKNSATAVAATGKVKTTGDSANSFDVEAIDAGAFGNKIGVAIRPKNIVNTIITEAVSDSSTTIKVRSTNGMVVGQKLFIADKLDTPYTIVSIDSVGRTVTFDTEVTSAIGTMSATVKSLDFNMDVTYKGSVVETFEGLTAQPNMDNFAEIVVNDDTNGSAYVRIMFGEEEFPDNAPKTDSVVVMLSGGDDGLSGVGDADLIGDASAKTGMYALNAIQDTFNLFIAESCSEEVVRAATQYCESRMDAFSISSVPEGYDVEETISYRMETGNFNTSYGALYHGWGNVADPIGQGSNPQKLVPLCGHIAGYYGRNDNKYDIGQVPAGEDAVLYGVNSLEYDMSDVENGDLNKNNINAIRSLSGAGIVIWGARTLSANTNWRYINARRIFIYVEKSVMLGTRWTVFKPSNDSTWKAIKRTVESFLNTVPGLYGSSPSERYAVVCDETTNPESVRKAGQIVCKIGLAVNSVGEFVIFEIGQMSEGTSLTE